MVGLHVIEYLLRVLWVWGFPWWFQWGFLWVWDGYGDWNAIPTAALVSEPLRPCSAGLCYGARASREHGLRATVQTDGRTTCIAMCGSTCLLRIHEAGACRSLACYACNILDAIISVTKLFTGRYWMNKTIVLRHGQNHPPVHRPTCTKPQA